MNLPESMHGTILLGHGSRDPLWRKPMEAVAERVRQLAPGVHVRCAYLEASSPDLPTCAREMVDLGVATITVLPLFLGLGKHAREDLPQLLVQLKSAYPGVVFNLRPAIGEEPQLIDLLARMALI